MPYGGQWPRPQAGASRVCRSMTIGRSSRPRSDARPILADQHIVLEVDRQQPSAVYSGPITRGLSAGADGDHRLHDQDPGLHWRNPSASRRGWRGRCWRRTGGRPGSPRVAAVAVAPEVRTRGIRSARRSPTAQPISGLPGCMVAMLLRSDGPARRSRSRWGGGPDVQAASPIHPRWTPMSILSTSPGWRGRSSVAVVRERCSRSRSGRRRKGGYRPLYPRKQDLHFRSSSVAATKRSTSASVWPRRSHSARRRWVSTTRWAAAYAPSSSAGLMPFPRSMGGW